MRFTELVELFETMAIDDFLQLTVVVVVQSRLGASDFQEFAILLGIRLPSNEDGSAVGVGVAVVSEFRPNVTHRICPVFVGIKCRLRQLVAVVVHHIEAVFEFRTVGAAFIAAIVRFSNGVHIDIRIGLALATDGVSGDDGLGTEQPVDAQQVLGHRS